VTEKIIGYSLLFVGIFLIIVSVFSVFQVFTGAVKPVQLFQMQGISLDLGTQNGIKLPSTEIVPAAMLNDTTNLFVHLLLMGFIASTGQKLASLGIELLRPIVVKLNEKTTA
jgi:hypothetical protein